MPLLGDSPKTYRTFDKTYDLGYAEVRLTFEYIANFLGNFEFNLNCLSLGQIESGYEDDDLLTFYPNVMHLQFTDIDRYNYEYLRQVVESYPDLTNPEVTLFEVWFNVKGDLPKRMFLGSVDKRTMKYTEMSRILEFDLVDVTQDLKVTTCDYIYPDPPNWASFYNPILRYIYTAYSQVFPDLLYNVTTDIETFKSEDFNGIYFQHNWEFKKFGGNFPFIPWISNWDDIAVMTNGSHPETYVFKKDNYAEMLKAIALQFGMSIGCEEPGKIYAFKRFVSTAWALDKTIDILPYLVNDYTKELWLPNLICVQNTFTYTPIGLGWPSYYTSVARMGDWRPNSSDPNKPENLDQVLEIETDTNSGSRMSSDTSLYLRDNGSSTGWSPMCEVKDPDIGFTNYLEYVIAGLYQRARERSKDKYEFEVYGIDWSMADYLKLQQDGFAMKVMRPMVIKKDLLNNKSYITALEIGM